MKKHKSVRWTKEQAASEFVTDPKTLGKEIRQLGIQPGKDGKFSTWDIVRATFGDSYSKDQAIKGEKLAELVRERQQAEKELVPVKELAQVLNRGITAIKGRIMSAANLEREDKDKICTECGELWASAFGANPADLEPPAAPDGQ